MLTAILGWLGSKGLSLLLGAVTKMLVDIYNSKQAAEAQKAAGKAEVEAAQAEQGKNVASKIADRAAEKLDEDDAISRMNEGEA